jgi:hypothetical protein
VSRDKSAQISSPQPGHMWAGTARGAHCVPAASGGYVNLRSSMYVTAAAVQAYSAHIFSRENLQPSAIRAHPAFHETHVDVRVAIFLPAKRTH